MISAVTLEITNNCNLRCRHCSVDGGPGGRTMPQADIRKIVNHLPGSLTYLSISGGEPFSVKQTLTSALEYIRDNRSKLFPKVSVGVVTNGFWIKNKASDVESLRELYDLGVQRISFAGDDDFHKEQGLDHKEIEAGALAARATLEEQLGGRETFKFMYFGSAPGMIAPFGRGKLLPLSFFRKKMACDLSSPLTITISTRGEAFLCCWKKSPSIGLVIATPLNDLLERALENPAIGGLIRGGPKGAALALGVYDQAREEEYATKACLICEGLFSGR
ncbi:MAG: radical SAM protein [Candidatus Saganbacteria bacterium]|nr:radical SAM protein [Candidatus Saganbacteria bacterium]